MGQHELTKFEALKLITPVVDEEANPQERKAFMDYIAEHQEVRDKYESMKNLKSMLQHRCPTAKAPNSLRQFVQNIDQHSREEKDPAVPIYDIPNNNLKGREEMYHTSSQQDGSSSKKIRKFIFAAAASLLLAATGWSFFNSFDFTSSGKSTYNIEEYAYQHFQKHNGQFVEPTIATASLGIAEIQMASDYDMPMTIPALDNTEFKGVVYGDFVPNYKAPMLEYYLPSEDQYIYIFAFKLDRLKKFGQLVRHQEAVKRCNKPKDFYVRNINGKHVVSWKWGNVWYAAISNHNGDTLASLVKPLQHDTGNK